MVGLVVVCHSRALARAAAALASEMTQGRPVAVEIAAGLDETTFGTDAVEISEAVVAADSGDGVVVLMDLGSAVLSAETALELLDDDQRARVVLCPAPLVEGLVAAAVTAAGGAPRDEVAAEAMAGLAGKQSHFGALSEEPGDPVSRTEEAPSAVVRVLNPHGLHARPAARLVSELRPFDARVELRNESTDSAWVPASSLTRVATLGALKGHELAVRASGPQAQQAIDRLVTLAAESFGESPVDHAELIKSGPALHRGSPATDHYPRSERSSPAPCGQPGIVDNSDPPSPQPTDTADPPSPQPTDTAAAPSPQPTDAAAAPSPRPTDAAAAPSPRPDQAAALSPQPTDAATVYGLTWQGTASSPGIAIGPAVRLHETVLEIPAEESRGSEAERDRLGDALATARREIGRLSGDIFEAHLVLLDDDDLLGDARARIDGGATAPQAWRDATDRVAAEFDALPDPYLRARAADVRAVAAQVLRALLGVAAATVDGEGILFAADLTPAEVAGLDPTRTKGVVLSGGSPTSHAAILLRTKGIPAVVGAGPIEVTEGTPAVGAGPIEIAEGTPAAGAGPIGIAEGTPAVMDGSTGEVVADPDPKTLADFQARVERQRTRRDEAHKRATEPAVTRAGVTIKVGANVGSVAEARAAAEHGADLAGLVRTEFLFLDRDTAPDADEQEAVYRRIAEALGGRRITLRTLDAGSDKPLPYLPAPVEANPFLGVRGIRHSLVHRAMFAEQLRAIVRVARETPVSVMFPMVTTVGEVFEARRMLDETTGGNTPAGMRVGMMVEVPAAAIRAAAFVPYVDFFSVGTNDLTQYTLAAERGNADLLSLASGLDPAVAELIDGVCRAAGDRVLVAVCGELAADETVVPRLLASGVRELSVAPSLVPLVKQAVRQG
ncbi:phosphoenolpyruvate--protein phosphotransferase [Actinoplanes sp. LDG1-06]|uniref:Phosphocarrier protein HPr n=1 Tax=Paractinoplanes ovalisporus TaxID=2810368 RepID=A0ABS2A4D4_9ACTN|nr:phosphoenolpyruvate--protein phosphotransferase [Actinoplanes ovalisporus]MBM2614715.1 phosphoenolpyruvate--protein phosphotransferase [Actinoplanes ovalisporus]